MQLAFTAVFGAITAAALAGLVLQLKNSSSSWLLLLCPFLP
jgi:hypothetical protein